MNVLFPLITFKYASNIIKANGIGAANFSSAVIGYVGLISSLGISAYAISEGAKIRKNKEKLSEFVSEVFTINLYSMTLSYCVLAILLVTVTKFEPYRLLILLYSTTILFRALGIEWFFTVKEKFSYITVRSIIFQLVSLVLLYVLVKEEQDTPWYVTLTAISSAGSGLLNFIYSRKIIRIKPTPIKRCIKHMKPIMIIWAANVASLIYVNADVIIIGFLSGDTANGHYSAAVKVVKAICMPISAIGVVAGPQLAEAISEKNREKINQITKQVFDFMGFLIFPCIVGLFLLGKESIFLISGKEFLPGLMAERILLLDIFFSPLNAFIANQIMIPIKKEKYSMIVMIIAATTNIVSDFILIKYIDINGAAIATVISEFLVFALCIPYVFKTVDIKVSGKDIWKYMVSSLCIIPVYYLCRTLMHNEWLLVGTTVCFSIIVYSILVGILTKKTPLAFLKGLRRK